MDVARREADGRVHAEAHDLARRVDELADARAVRTQPLEDTDRLEEVEGGGPLLQLLRDEIETYRSGFHPDLGGHSASSCLRCLLFAASTQKLFRLTYSPRNRSSTAASR